MDTNTNVILGKEEFDAVRNAVKDCEERIKVIKREEKALQERLNAHCIGIAKEKLFSNVNIGDKVEVAARGWNDNIITSVGFLNDIRLRKYSDLTNTWTLDAIDQDPLIMVTAVFSKVKKDGTASLNTFDYNCSNIVSIKKAK